MKGRSKLLGASVASAIAFGLGSPAAQADEVIVGLITKTETNPFFVKMRQGAQEKAKELGIKLVTAAGKYVATITPRWRRSRI